MGSIIHSSNLAVGVALPVLIQVLPWLLPNARQHPAKTSSAILGAFSVCLAAAWWILAGHPLDVTDSTTFDGQGMTAAHAAEGLIHLPGHRDYLGLTFSVANRYPEAEDCVPASSLTAGIRTNTGPAQSERAQPGSPAYFSVPASMQVIHFWVRLRFRRDSGCVMNVNVTHASLQEWK
jgi:hypothetical protein